jgi:23S rRNA pseudouridine1911/1915/1917 synthase
LPYNKVSKVKYKKPGNVYLGLVHRLDRPVAGVVLLAKTSKAASRLSESFRNREVKKIYWAIVEGRVNPSAGTLVGQMESGEQGSMMVEAPRGKRVELKYRTLRNLDHSTLLEVDLGTGRKHQIRCQLSHLGYPILGDTKYGAQARNQGEIALLCHRLEVSHPVKKEERIQVEVPNPLWRVESWLT